MHDDARVLRLAAVSGNRMALRHLMVCAMPKDWRGNKAVAREWMTADGCMRNILAAAAGVDAGRQDIVDMLVGYVRRAGVEKEALLPVMPLILYYAAKSGDITRLDRVWRQGVDSLGAPAMQELLSQKNGELITALAVDENARPLARVLELAHTDFGKAGMLKILLGTAGTGYGTLAGLRVLLNAARKADGDTLVEAMMTVNNYGMFTRACAHEDTAMLELLQRNLPDPDRFMGNMLKGSYLASILPATSVAGLKFLAAKAYMTCGNAPILLMMRGMAEPSVAGRSDYLDILTAGQMICKAMRVSGDAAVPRSVIDAIMAHNAKTMPRHEFWQRVGGGKARWYEVTNAPAPEGVNPYSSPWNFKPKLYAELLPHMRRMATLEDYTKVKPEQLAYRFAVLFSNREEVERYIDQTIRKARPDGRGLPFMNAAHFTLPGKGLWNVAHWRGVLSKCGPVVGKYLFAAAEIEDYCRTRDMKLPHNTAEIIDVARFILYADADRHPEFARLATQYDLSQPLFAKGLKILTQQKKRSDRMPDVMIDGTDIGIPNYYMHKLPANDARGLVLGHIVNNCQTLGNNGEYAAISGMTDSHTGFYVWKQKTGGKITDNDRIVAESWAWLSDNKAGQEIVFDSFERLSPVYNHLARPFLEQYAHDLGKAGTLSRVFLGAGGCTPKSAGFEKAQTPARPRAADREYPDSVEQYTVRPVNHRRPP
jgi:hypothetical protein